MFKFLSLAALIAGCVVVSGCAPMRTQSSPSFGAWQPVHEYPVQSLPVPIAAVVMFRVTPMDSSLRHLLARWAFMEGKQLQYSLPMDWQIHRDASLVSAATLDDALARLTAAYAPHHLVFRADGAVITATGVSNAAP